MSLPQISAEFRLGTDPNLRFAPSGVAVCGIRAVASSRKKNDKDEWVDDKTCWVELVGFKQLAENMAESFAKGDQVVATGRLQTEDWTDNDGNKRTSVKVILDNIGMAARFNAVRSIKADRQSQGAGQGQQGQGQDDPFSGQQQQQQSDEPPF